MAEVVEYRCPDHANAFDCPDNLIVRTNKGYGLIIHDGGSSFMPILFCPWCGTRIDGIPQATSSL